jgi:plastocyanin
MRRFRWGFVGFGLVLAIEGLGTGAASAANQAVSIFDFGFTPTPLSSTVGDTVTWTNSTSGTPHTVTRCDAGCPVGPGTGTDSGFGSSAIISGGGTYAHTFTAPGSYIYYCQIHGYASMNAEVDVVASPRLRVQSSPALATQILVDGQIADSWGLTWLKVPSGSHTVGFTHVEGYTEPAVQTVMLNAGAITTVTGSFTQRGSLRVLTSPAKPSQISVDGIPRDNWGMWTDIPVGSHQVCFGPTPNFTPPACQTAVVTAGMTTTITGTMTNTPGTPGLTGVGRLRVTTSPALPSQITVNGNIADSWGLAWLQEPPGAYTVCFIHIEGYTEPACSNQTVTVGVDTIVVGTFTQRGSLRVLTSPAVAGTISVDGVPRNDWGMWTDIPTGSHMVCFGPAVGKANTPPCQMATVNAGALTVVTGNYS